MKKFTVLCLAGLLVLAFGVSAYAQEPKLEFRASGFIDTQTHWSENVPPLNANATPIYNSIPTDYRSFTPVTGAPAGALNRTVSYWDSRMHLAFDAIMGKELDARLQFEIDACRWGNSQGGIRPGSEAHAVGVWSTDRVAIEIKYMYFDVALPYFGIPVPMTVRLGAQPFAIRPWFFAATDGMGVSGGIKIDPVNINPFYFKPAEGFDWTADDVDIYGLQANARLGTFTIGGYGAFYNMNQYPMANQPETTNPPVAPALPVYPSTGNQAQANLWWLGLYADGKAGPVNINFDMGYDFGEVNPHGNASLTQSKVKYSGWAGRLKIDYPWEKFNFGVTGMYASGSDANKTSSTGLPGSLAANGSPSTRVNGWMVPVGAEAGAANGESVIIYGMEAGASGGQGFGVSHNYNQASKGPFGGSWFAKLYGSYKITPWYKVTLQGLYIGDTTKNGDTYGNSRNFGNPGQPLQDHDFIGVELNLLNEIQIYRNLTFKVFGGYMWAGNAMKLFDDGNGTNFQMHNPWAVRTRLMYSF
jgi:hypothetical protein